MTGPSRKQNFVERTVKSIVNWSKNLHRAFDIVPVPITSSTRYKSDTPFCPITENLRFFAKRGEFSLLAFRILFIGVYAKSTQDNGVSAPCVNMHRTFFKEDPDVVVIICFRCMRTTSHSMHSSFAPTTANHVSAGRLIQFVRRGRHDQDFSVLQHSETDSAWLPTADPSKMMPFTPLLCRHYRKD